MSTFTLRRFTSQETLKSIRADNLLSLLGKHGAYFASRGVTLDARAGEDRTAAPVDGEIDYEGIAQVLMTPEEATPRELVDDLFFVDEMATPEGMEALREEIAKLAPAERKPLEFGPAPTPADVAVIVRLHAPAILERTHAEILLSSKRSFHYFQPANGNSKPFTKPTDKQLRSLEAVFDDFFDKMKRGRNSKIYVFERPEEVWLLVRHGDPCKREGALSSSGSSSVYYRPEVFDVIRYDHKTSELSINAGSSKKIYDLYREKVGLHFFGDALYFPAGMAKFTLDPLRSDGESSLVCVDVDGMDSVVLQEVHYFWGGPENEVEIRRASNIFKAMQRRDRSIPDNARISRAKFQVKFTDSKTPRMVTVSNSNVSSFTRDSDAPIVDAWLTKRGFAIVGGNGDA
jgi:hypothetical protein